MEANKWRKNYSFYLYQHDGYRKKSLENQKQPDVLSLSKYCLQIIPLIREHVCISSKIFEKELINRDHDLQK